MFLQSLLCHFNIEYTNPSILETQRERQRGIKRDKEGEGEREGEREKERGRETERKIFSYYEFKKIVIL